MRTVVEIAFERLTTYLDTIIHLNLLGTKLGLQFDILLALWRFLSYFDANSSPLKVLNFRLQKLNKKHL